MRERLSDRIMFDWCYPVFMFPVYWSDKNKDRLPKLVRLLLFIIGMLWFFMCLPVMGIIMFLIILPLTVWEDI